MIKCLYLIGGLKQYENIVRLGIKLEKALGFEIYRDWVSAGKDADDYWRDHEKAKGNGLKGALKSWASKHVFEEDKRHLDRSDGGILVWPCGKSCHLELGYLIGQGKPGWILIDGEPERYDVMLQFANGVATTEEELIEEIKDYQKQLSEVRSRVESLGQSWQAIKWAQF